MQHKIQLSDYTLTAKDLETIQQVKELFDNISTIKWDEESVFTAKHSYVKELSNLKVGDQMIVSYGSIYIFHILVDLKFFKAKVEDDFKRLADKAAKVVYSEVTASKGDIALFAECRKALCDKSIFPTLSSSIAIYLASLLMLKAGDKIITSYNKCNLNDLTEYLYTPLTRVVNARLEFLKKRVNTVFSKKVATAEDVTLFQRVLKLRGNFSEYNTPLLDYIDLLSNIKVGWRIPVAFSEMNLYALGRSFQAHNYELAEEVFNLSDMTMFEENIVLSTETVTESDREIFQKLQKFYSDTQSIHMQHYIELLGRLKVGDKIILEYSDQKLCDLAKFFNSDDIINFSLQNMYKRGKEAMSNSFVDIASQEQNSNEKSL